MFQQEDSFSGTIEDYRKCLSDIIASEEYRSAYSENVVFGRIAGASTNPILLNGECLYSVEETMRILLHEHGHHLYGHSETKAENFAQLMLRKYRDAIK